MIEESHLSVHTWPEAGYAAVDFYTCGTGDLQRAHDVLERGPGATSTQTLMVRRGGEGLKAVPWPRRDRGTPGTI